MTTVRYSEEIWIPSFRIASIRYTGSMMRTSVSVLPNILETRMPPTGFATMSFPLFFRKTGRLVTGPCGLCYPRQPMKTVCDMDGRQWSHCRDGHL